MPDVNDTPAPILIARNLTKRFTTRSVDVLAVDDVSFTLERGKTVGIVGESGSGKSTVARLILGLYPPSSGTAEFDGVDIARASSAQMRAIRMRMQAVFQNPFGSLLPHYSAVANIMEPMRIHRQGTAESRRRRALELCELVGVDPALADRYPSQYSGGQQQRIAIARALALNPEVLVCDEPTSSLDVSIQAQILALLETLRAELDLSCVFISHNLAVVERLADSVVVMAQGKVVEQGTREQVFENPREDYTRSLLRSVLRVSA